MLKRLKEIPSNIDSDISGLARYRIKDTDELTDPTMKDRLGWAALGGLIGLAGSIITPKMLPKSLIGTKGFPHSLKAGITLATAGAAYLSPDARNIMIREKRGEISRQEAKKTLREYGKIDDKIFKTVGELAAMKSDMEKKAFLGIGTGIKKGFGFGFKQARNFAGTRIGKIGLAGAGAYGTYRGGKAMMRKPYEQNYTTFMRNQSLRGNIQPGEMSRNDLVSVRKMGMR